MAANNAGTVWLTGLPGAGKSTLAQELAGVLRGRGRRVQVLDGDEMRAGLSADLGFSEQDRNAHVRRVGFVAQLLVSHDVTAIVPVIAPYAAVRHEVRRQHRERGLRYFEVHVATPVAECKRRDPKGLYARAEAGQLRGLTGFDATYEEPVDPELRLDTTDLTPEAARQIVLELLGLDSVPA